MKKKWLSLFLLIHNIFFAHPNFIETYKIVNNNKIIIKANKEFSQQFIKEDFFAEYDENINLTKLDESIITIPFILAIIPVVWLSNKTYAIDVMERDLYYSLQKVRDVLRICYPNYQWAGELIPKKLVINTVNLTHDIRQPAMALFFTGGLDSTEASLKHVDIRQLLITAWGADVKIKDAKGWQMVQKQVQQFGQVYGHDNVFVKSNFREFIETYSLYNKFPRWWVRVSFGLSLIGLAAPLLEQNNIPILLISSSTTVKYPYPVGSHPAINNNVSFAGRTVYLASGDKDRVQKIKSINAVCKEKKLALPQLRVCWSDSMGGDCLECEKCLRSCVNIIIAGQLPQTYGFAIDIKDIVQKLRKIFTKKKRGYLHPSQIDLWESNILYLDALCEQQSFKTVANKKEIKELRDFLHSINFQRYRNPRTRFYSMQEKEVFVNLWEQNIKNDDEIVTLLPAISICEKKK